MRKGFTIFTAMLIVMLMSNNAFSQFRADQPNPYNRTGTITNPSLGEDATDVFGLFDMQMNQSYEMNFGAMGGGNLYNQNIFTNTMFMRFNENFHGRVDLSVAHSPFGNSPMMGQDQGMNFYIRNAELKYNLSENSTIRIQYQQNPGGYGYYGRSPYGHSPFGRHRW